MHSHVFAFQPTATRDLLLHALKLATNTISQKCFLSGVCSFVRQTLCGDHGHCLLQVCSFFCYDFFLAMKNAFSYNSNSDMENSELFNVSGLSAQDGEIRLTVTSCCSILYVHISITDMIAVGLPSSIVNG